MRITGINLTDYLIVLAALVTLVLAVRSGKRLPVYAWALLPFVVLFLIALVGSISSGDPLLSAGGTRRWIVGNAITADYGTAPLILVLRMGISLTAVAIIVAGGCGNSSNGLLFAKRVMYSWALGSAVSGAYAVAENFVPALGSFQFLYRILAADRHSGLTNHPNHLGEAIVIALPLLVYMASTERGLVKVVSTILLPVSMYALLLSGSRGALVAGPVVLGVMFIHSVLSTKRIQIWTVLAAPVGIALIMLVIPTALSLSRFGEESAERSSIARLVTMEQATADFLSDPILGVAIGAPATAMVPLTVLVYGGSLYFVVFYGSLIYPLVVRPRSVDGRLTATLMISSAAVLGYGLLNNAWADRYLYWPFAALFALSLHRRSVDVPVGEENGRDVARQMVRNDVPV